MERKDEGAHRPVALEAVGIVVGRVTSIATATVRRNFSIPHLAAAEHFANELRSHEAKHAGAGWGPHFDYCGWNASAAIILSFSAIEAALDEAEDDLALPAELTDALDRAPTLEHAQALLAHRACTIFDRGAEPFQNAELLRALRNGLVHPKAEWDNARDLNKQLSRKIIGAHLPLSPFQPDPDLAFPHGCMSAGVASWAASSARHFIREFRSRLELRATV
ncbi:MAG TPA: hypothetical protein VHZ26_11420 [Caulobacteraceae bacterium]|nr:hypothetical protein [Caulobacteraceae bacterium]